jgi:hypothetical protein
MPERHEMARSAEGQAMFPDPDPIFYIYKVYI